MKIHVEITGDPLEARGVAVAEPGCGAVVEFAGLVRGEEDGVAIAALDYEAYEAMARSEWSASRGSWRPTFLADRWS